MLLESRRCMKPFGWGDSKVHFDAITHDTVKAYLRDKFATDVIYPEAKTFSLASVNVGASKLAPEALAALRALFGADGVSTGKDMRAVFSGGRSYRDLLRMRSLEVRDAPDAVIFPRNEEQLVELMRLAERYKLALVPFAGGTSVVGGLDAYPGALSGSLAIDMTPLCQVQDFDAESQLLTVGAGIYGLDLEAYLNTRGFTLGHFPQSFEYTTLGGWIAARSSGQNSLLYGSIDKLVFSLKVLTPAGMITTPMAPNLACGPDIKQVLIGAEGVYGLVLAATLKVRKRHEHQYYGAYLFKSFDAAAEAARAIVQSEVTAAMVRVSDEGESESMLALGSSGPSPRLKTWLRQLGMWRLRRQGFAIPRVAMMTLGLEGSASFNAFQRQQLMKVLAGHDYWDLGPKPGQRWLRERFKLPYARDAFMDQNLLVDTFETATTWKNRKALYTAVQQAMADVCKGQQVRYSLFCHLSHVYPTGTSLYFTIICQQQKDALRQWQEIKAAASRAIVTHAGVISHHHGIGRDHKDYLPWGGVELKVWQAVKQALDPHGIMNPGKLL